MSSERLMKPGSQEASGELSPASVRPRPFRRPSSRRRPPDGLQCVAGLFDVPCHGDMLPDDVVVFRDGVQTTLPATLLVPGDLVQISRGQKVPADVKSIDISGDLRFDRSVLTGEVCVTTRAQS